MAGRLPRQGMGVPATFSGVVPFASFTGVLPQNLNLPQNFTGVVPPPGGFSGVVPNGSGTPMFTGPTLSPLLVKEAVVNLRQAFAEQRSTEPRVGGQGDDDDAASAAPDHYGVLELQKGAAEEAIKKSYRKLVLLWHPDKHPSDREEADDKIRKINSAYETLGNPVKRDGYNQMLEAIERKKKNLRLDTSFIKPRMSIPKEFMLCPLGHPDKFVRAVHNELRVQSRDDVRDNFNDFFNKAKFTIWWLPEVNNMCRIRTAESAGSGQEGGMMVNFTMEGAPTEGGQLCTKDADCVMRTNEDPRYSNVIAVASPFSPGAFRFEGAFWPGHYLSFRAPGTVCMAGLVDEVKDITDFFLVDYSAAYKTMTMDEALLGPVTQQGGGDYVKLSDLRADISVRAYFQNMLKSGVWNNREFEMFFEGHYEQWDFDKKRSRVKPRSASQQLAEKLRRAKQHSDVVTAVLGAEEELSALPVGVAERSLDMIVQGGPQLELTSSAGKTKDAISALRKMLSAMPCLCVAAREARGPGEVAALSAVLSLRRMVLRCPTFSGDDKDKENSKGKDKVGGTMASDQAQEETPLSVLRAKAAQSLAGLVSERLAAGSEKASPEIIVELLGLPLDWGICVEAMCDAVTPVLAQAQPPGDFLEMLRAAVHAGEGALPFAEAVARRELKSLSLAEGPVAVEVLQVLVESRILLREVCAALRPPTLQRLPLPELVRLLSSLSELRPTDENLRPALEMRIKSSGTEPELASVPAGDLLRLVEASHTSPLVEELALSAIVSATTAALGNWSAEDIPRLLLALAKSKAINAEGMQELFAKAAEVLGPSLSKLELRLLIEMGTAVGALDSGRALLEALGKSFADRLSDIDQAQIAAVIECLVGLGAKDESLLKVLDHWEHLLGSKDKGLPRADQVARLVQLLAPVVPDHDKAFQAMGEHIERHVRHLSDKGRASLEAAFPKGEGPSFRGKDTLLRSLNLRKRSRSRDRGRGGGAARANSETAAASGDNGDKQAKQQKKPRPPKAKAEEGSEQEDRQDPPPRRRSRGDVRGGIEALLRSGGALDAKDRNRSRDRSRDEAPRREDRHRADAGEASEEPRKRGSDRDRRKEERAREPSPNRWDGDRRKQGESSKSRVSRGGPPDSGGTSGRHMSRSRDRRERDRSRSRDRQRRSRSRRRGR